MLWGFCVRSLFREYGWRFFWRIAARHPLRTVRAFREGARLDASGNGMEVNAGTADRRADGPPSIVGAGFCLKPVTPPCPSGRSNHDCWFLENLAGTDTPAVPAPCRACTIREIGTQSLRAGSAFYVMTSARDILDDVYVPTLETGRFPTGLFVLCRYSFRPFAIGLLASGVRAWLLALEGGDCRDYHTWLLADRGIKDEQTSVSRTVMADAAAVLRGPALARAWRVERRGNVLYPVATTPAVEGEPAPTRR